MCLFLLFSTTENVNLKAMRDDWKDSKFFIGKNKVGILMCLTRVPCILSCFSHMLYNLYINLLISILVLLN